MSTNKHIENSQQNEFDRIIREKLKEHRTPVDSKIWDKLEANLSTQAKPKKKTLLWYYVSGAVAAVVALMFLIHPFENNGFEEMAMEDMKEVAQPSVTSIEQSLQANKTDAVKTKNTHRMLSGEPPLGGRMDNKHNQWIAQRADDATRQQTKSNNYIIENGLSIESVVENKEEGLIVSEENRTISNKEEQGDVKNTSKKQISTLPDKNDYADYKKTKELKKEDKKPILTAYAGTNGNIKKMGEKEPVMIATKAEVLPRFMVNRAISEEYALSVLRPEDYSEVQHNAPLALGVRVEIPVNKILGIETGVSYTYLKSYFSRAGTVRYFGTLQLHYLGVPLNVRAKLFRGENWNIYATIGGMLEKGVRSQYHQQVDGPFATTNTDVNASIDGVQWSVNGGVGIDVKLNRAVSLFAEPTATYYLKNNQPMNARTEQPLNFGINGGLRFNL